MNVLLAIILVFHQPSVKTPTDHFMSVELNERLMNVSPIF